MCVLRPSVPCEHSYTYTHVHTHMRGSLIFSLNIFIAIAAQMGPDGNAVVIKLTILKWDITMH